MIPTDGGGASSGGPEIEQVGSVSFTVAPGDPDAIDSAAVWHEQVSSQMGAHAQAITSASGQALSQWEGDAASSYADLSSQMTAAFKANEVRAGDTAATMHSIAHELDNYQQEGKTALRQAQHWVEQAITDHATATRLKSELAQAKQTATLATAPPGMDTHLGIDPPPNDSSSQAKAAEAKVALLTRELTAATTALHEDNVQIQRWDKRGQQAWEDAEAAVSRFMTIPIEPIAAPPMPGTPTFTTPQHESFWDQAWHVIKDGATDVVNGVVDGGKYILDHPVIIDGLAIVAAVAIPGGGLYIVLADGAYDEGSTYYQYKTGQISEKQFWEDSAENGTVTAVSGGTAAALGGLTDAASKGTTSVSKATIGRVVGIPATGLSTVWTAGSAKEHG